MHERRHVHHLDGDSGRNRRLAVGGEEAEQRPQPLAARRQRLARHLLRQAGPRGDGTREARLDLRHVGRDAGRRVHLRELLAHSRGPRVQRDDRAGEQAEAHVAEAAVAQHPRQRLGVREPLHRRRQVRVGGAAGQHLAEHGHDAVEPEREERPQRTRAAA